MPAELLVTCEHGGHDVPAAYRSLFGGSRAAAVLRSHRGWDPGALAVARVLARRARAPLHVCRVTRLLVEVNRSIHHRRLFSEYSARLSPEHRARLLARYYHPYRDGVEAAVQALVARGRPVLHVSVHSFASRWHGHPRTAEIGLLYDPSRPGERRLSRAWQQCLGEGAPGLRIRRNYPYRGVSDGLVTTLRRRFGPRRYLAIELELSQQLVSMPGPRRRRVADLVATSLQAARACALPSRLR